LASERDDPADAGQLARLRLEEARARELVQAEDLARALDLVEEAVPQVSPRALPALHERLSRAAARAKARMERRP
jgi:hypothetical protein